MERLPDWRTALNQLVEERRETPHVFGTHDCALWYADAHLVVWGDDPAAGARGKYKTATGAAKTLRKVFRVDRVEKVPLALFGPMKPISMARAGDPVIADLAAMGLADPTEGLLGLSLGVCLGSTSYLTGVDGLVPVRTLDLVGCHHHG